MDPSGFFVDISPHARRALKKLPSGIRDRIAVGLAGLAADPPAGDIKKLAGAEDLLRIGDWRVIVRRDSASRTVTVLSIAHRRDAYRT